MLQGILVKFSLGYRFNGSLSIGIGFGIEFLLSFLLDIEKVSIGFSLVVFLQILDSVYVRL